MASRFLLQIVHRDTGEVVQAIEPGSRIEVDIIEDFIRRAHGFGVGFGRTKASVEVSMRRAWVELLRNLKSQVRP